MAWPKYTYLPSEEELAEELDGFLGERPEFDGFIKIGKTVFIKETGQPRRRYDQHDQYEVLTPSHVLCECETEELALKVEQLAQKIAKERGILIRLSDAANGGMSGDRSKKFCVYVTKFKPDLFKCPFKSCSFVATFDGILMHQTKHFLIKLAMDAVRIAEKHGLEPPEIETFPVPWTYSPSKSTECVLCGKNFGTNADMKVHLDHNCPNNKDNRKMVPCVTCGEYFSARYIRQHMKIHAGTSREPCKICGKLIAKTWMKSHIRDMHSNDPKVECDVCSKKVSKDWLPKHKKIHAGIKVNTKMWKCEECGHEGLEIYKKSHLNSHSTTMEPCPHCKKSFKKHRLALHIKDYHIKSTVKCQQCDFEGTPEQLRTHKIIHEPPVKCPYCSKEYKKNGFNRHKKECAQNAKREQ